MDDNHDMIRDRNVKFAAFQTEVDTLKQNLSKHVKEKESLSTKITVLKTEFKEEKSQIINKEITLENRNKDLENTFFKQYQSTKTLHMITRPQVYYDNTHKQALGYQNPFYLKKAQRIRPTLYDDFGKCFVPQMEMSVEQAYWLPISNPKSETPVKIKVPAKLPKVSLVNISLKKLKYHLANFDKVVKVRITPDAITEGSWGFEHTKVVFINEVIPFLKSLKDIFNAFDTYLINEITEVQTVFNQMEAVAE
ncbi:hypothetical protein Tco_0132094 [Tanacetum coccineum]